MTYLSEVSMALNRDTYWKIILPNGEITKIQMLNCKIRSENQNLPLLQGLHKQKLVGIKIIEDNPTAPICQIEFEKGTTFVCKINSSSGVLIDLQNLCVICQNKANYIRHTQFAGQHPFCKKHAEAEEDFNKEDSYIFWEKI